MCVPLFASLVPFPRQQQRLLLPLHPLQALQPFPPALPALTELPAAGRMQWARSAFANVPALIPGAARLSAFWTVFLLQLLLLQALQLPLRVKTITSAVPAADSTSRLISLWKFPRFTAGTVFGMAEKLTLIAAVPAARAPTAGHASTTATAGSLIALTDYAEGFIVPTA